jgi:putative membrane protein
MPQNADQSKEPDFREYFAAERTILAYVRTGIAMMGIGFVVARFSLMLRMIPSTASTSVQHEPSAHSLWLGTSLILSGTLIMALAALQYKHQVGMLNRMRGNTIPVSRLAVGLALGAGILGIAMAIYVVANTKT